MKKQRFQVWKWEPYEGYQPWNVYATLKEAVENSTSEDAISGPIIDVGKMRAKQDEMRRARILKKVKKKLKRK